MYEHDFSVLFCIHVFINVKYPLIAMRKNYITEQINT